MSDTADESEYADVEGTRINYLRKPSELFELPRTIPFVVDRLLPALGLGIWYGETGVGKTATLLQFVVCIAMGLPFFGHEVVRIPVLYLVGEGAAGIPQRLFALLEFFEVPVADIDDWLTFRLVPTPLYDHDVQRDVGREVFEKGVQLPGLVIIDTHSSNAGHQFDENSTAQNKEIADGLRSFTRTNNALVLLVHHSGGEGTRIRGSSDLIGSADVSIKVGKQGETLRTLTVEKARDFKPPAVVKMAMRARFGGLVFESVESRDITTLQPSQKLLLLCLRDAMTRANVAHVRSTDWQAEATFSKAQFFVIKRELLNGQFVEQNTAGHYGLTALGSAALEANVTASGPVKASEHDKTSEVANKTGLTKSRSLRTGHQTSAGPVVLSSPPEVRQTSDRDAEPQMPPIDDAWWNAVQQDDAA